MHSFIQSGSAMVWSAVTLLPTLLTYLLLLLLVLYGWFRWSHCELLRTAAGLPEVLPTWPILGHCYLLFGGRDGLARGLLEIAQKVAAQGLKTASFWVGPLPLITVYDLDDIQMILNSSSLTEKADEYEHFNIWYDSEAGSLNHNLLTAPAAVWKVTRKHMNRLFHPRNLQHMIPVMNQNSRELVSCLSGHVGQGYVNVMPHTMDTALKTVCNLLFGPEIDIDIKSSDFQGLMSVVETIPDLFITRLMRLWLRSETIFRFLYRHDLKKLNTNWINFTNSRIKKIHEISEKKRLNKDSLTQKNVEDTTVMTSEEPLNIVDAYSEMQKTHPEFTEADMRYEILVFYCTGTDTVGSAVASCLLALAHFQDVQKQFYQKMSNVVGPGDDMTLHDLNKMLYLYQLLRALRNVNHYRDVFMRNELNVRNKIHHKVESGIINLDSFRDKGTHWAAYFLRGRYAIYYDPFGLPPPTELERLYQEISNVVGPDHDVTLQDINNMPYLDQVLKETLRWFRTVPFILRKTAKDINISTCTIPAGYTVSVCLAGVHMNPKLYPQPLAFDPDRFSTEKTVGKDRFAFLAFGGGPRDCIGKTYSMQLMKIMVVHVLRKYKLRTDMDIFKLRKRLVVTLVNMDGYRLALENRH